MRRTLVLLLALTVGCSGGDSKPANVAERFHEHRVDGDDRALHALLTETDREVVPLTAFPAELPSRVMADLMGWGEAAVDSSTVLRAENDTATVVLYIGGSDQDTVHLLATHDPLGLLLFEIDRVRWRVALGLAEYALIDSLATAVQESGPPTDSASVASAEAYLEAAERFPEHARSADVYAARSILRAAEVAEALRIEVHMARTIDGVNFVEGTVRNPTDQRIGTLTLAVRDATGEEEEFELWDMGPGSSTAVWQITRLTRGPLTFRVADIQVL